MKPISLKTLLILLLLPLFLLMGAVLYATNLGHTRDFLQRQLGNHAQDGATALALRLSTSFAAGDMAAVASAVDALYDSGYYRTIVLERAGGGVLLHRSEPLRVEDVPRWFMALLPMATPEGRAEVTTGWRRVAQVRMASHPGYAYVQLWQSARSTLLWTLGFCAATALLLIWVLNRALGPLAAMERLALRVAEGRFERLGKPAGIRELDHIGAALNRMSAAVERMLGDKTRLIEQLQRDLHHDPDTGLANRAYFQSMLDNALGGGSARGLVLLQVSGLTDLNARQGREAGDRLVKTVGMAVETTARRHDAAAARLNGSQFALLLEDCDDATLDHVAGALLQAVEQAAREQGSGDACAFHAGTAPVEGGDASTLLARADAALRDARLGPSGSFRQGRDAAPAREAMRRLLQEAVGDIRLELAWQPLVRCADRGLEYHEALARLADHQGRLLPAGNFIALAEEEGLVTTLDRHILSAAWASLGAERERAGGVNVSGLSLASPDFVAWLRGFVDEPGRLYLECTLGRAAATPSALEALAGLKLAGFRIVLDRFVPSAAALEQMAELMPDWVKVEGGLCRHARAHAGTRVLLRSLCEYAHELGIRVAATGVEREEDVSLLQGLGLDAAQGRVFEMVPSPGHRTA